MDLGTSIIGALIIAICIAPFFLMNRKKKNEEKKSKQLLVNFANNYNAKITQYEICGNYIIGIDEDKKYIFFIKNQDFKTIEQFVDLAEIKNCKVINTSITFTNNKSNYHKIDKLELILKNNKPSESNTVLEFFNADFSIQLYDERTSIEKWSCIINNILQK